MSLLPDEKVVVEPLAVVYATSTLVTVGDDVLKSDLAVLAPNDYPLA